MSPAKPRARLHVSADLADGAVIDFDRPQAHYIIRVLRMADGERVALFNGRDGEWAGRLALTGRSGASVSCQECLRPQRAEPDIWLVFAPLKKSPMDFVVEKATELGAARLIPVVTERTVVSRVNLERLEAQAVEAAEQCERLSVPTVAPLAPLPTVLREWPATRGLLLMDETGHGKPIAGALAELRETTAAPHDYGILIGPEGGFSPSELDGLRKLPIVTAVTAGPRILRAETAAVAALACWQALVGDWT